ncbi:LysR family transcriptional regulator [uncultured Rhodoferax sp.]|uniref:LysR family transcriptional regulator n=1 Tax=uncultured Rhodoferax sp. TaxID=223188 RepID=UPI0025FF3FC0|nr:LysR family transcriptional regulator [uncultured Rhodoferax sp.]
MKALQDLDIFVRTVDTGSLSATARALDITPAAASAALKRLEAELHAPLLVRSTRSLRLTPEGSLFLEHARLALATLGEGMQALSTGRHQVQGVLRLAASSDMGRNVLLPWLDAFQARHPQLRYRLTLSDRMSNLFSEPVDAAFRHGKPRDSSLVALPVAPNNRRVLVASPAYVQQHGAPATPQDLAAHDCLCFVLGEEVNDRWTFRRGDDALVVRAQGGHVCNDGDVVRRWALAGRGVAYKAWVDVAQDVVQGRLQLLCPEWDTEPVPLYMVLPDRRQLTPGLRLLREFVAEACAAWPQPPAVGNSVK